ncbi:MAG TPA: NUDIX domain-containing protein [Herbaspirillum sp.]|jgi:ADP-ribose pyrophosphatase YjhB (NUDIX family)
MKILSRVGVFVVRRYVGSGGEAGAELLMFSHTDEPGAALRIPGGEIQSREEPYAAALRKLHQRAGIEFLPLIRALGVFETPSTAEPNAVSRSYCYLFDGAGLPDRWSHVVAAEHRDKNRHGADAPDYDGYRSLRLSYRWRTIGSDLFGGADVSLRGDHNYFLNADAIPELFEAELQ